MRKWLRSICARIRSMCEHPLPIGIGDREVQQRFIATHEVFLREFPDMRALADKMFDLTLERYNDPSEADNTELRLAQIIVFYLGRTPFDDFRALLLIAANGTCTITKKLLRRMYDHLATAGFISQNP